MAQKFMHYNIVASCPSDMVGDREKLQNAVAIVNEQNAHFRQMHFDIKHWQKDVLFGVGDPQLIINNSIIKNADMVIALFGSRLGAPTARATSGTIEEIEEMIKAGKQVFVCFSEKDITITASDSEEKLRDILKVKEFQKNYPNIDYELLLGDYSEIENWILEGRVDCGFLRLPTHKDLETIFLAKDKLLAILPENHYLANKENLSLSDLCNEPFLMLDKGNNSDISKIFEQNGISPKIHFTTWDDYAIMSMVESGLGISILPELILRRIPYKLVFKELDIPAYRNIGLAFRNKKTMSLAVEKFLEYLKYR